MEGGRREENSAEERETTARAMSELQAQLCLALSLLDPLNRRIHFLFS